MIVSALVMMALAQAPAGSATLSGQVVDAEGRPAAGIDVLLSGMGSGSWGLPVLSQAKSDRDGKFRIDAPAEKDPRRPHFLLAVWAYAPKTGLAGQAFSPPALPAAGSVQLKLGGPVHTAVRVVGPDGKPVAGDGWRRCWCAWPEGSSPGRRSRRPTRSPTCSRPRPTPRARGKSRAVERRISRRS